jgi:23S rRNA (guanosine2251-2'-O)-methyltransferase
LSLPRTELVYGLHAVRALLQQHPERVQGVWVARGRHDPRALEIEQLARSSGRRLERVDPAQLSARVGPTAHQGVVAEVQPLAPWSEEQLLDALTRSREPLLLCLDGVQDPHNLGACLRTADACGALAVLVPRDRAVAVNATVRKVAAGAAESTPVTVVTNLARTLRLLKQAGLWIVGADATGAQRAQDVDLSGGRVLVLGAEGSGLRQLTRQHCDWLVRLPSEGLVESLNVSVACGMLLYEALRQRAAAATSAAVGGPTPGGPTPGAAVSN